MAEHEGRQLATLPSHDAKKKAETPGVGKAMRPFANTIASPQTRLIIRNAVETLPELGYRSPDPANVSKMLSDDDFRSHLVKEITAMTPGIWSDDWRDAWSMDVEPLLSKEQGRAFKRLSLIRFWTEEWERLPQEARRNATFAARRAR